MKLIDGKKIAVKILKSLEEKNKKTKIKPRLAVILVGNDQASHLYVSLKEKKAGELGVDFEKYLLPRQTNEGEILKLLERLNNNRKVTAILVQLPLPKGFKTEKIIRAIAPEKDADGIQPENLKVLERGERPRVLPATTGAIVEALRAAKVEFNNKSMAIIGRSKIVGLPTYYFFRNKVRKIDIYDKNTKNLAEKTKRADILIVAIGSAEFVKENYIKKGAVVIDVGINKKRGKTVGDVDFINVKDKVKAITPVPGGIGPLTVAVLMHNVINLHKKQRPN